MPAAATFVPLWSRSAEWDRRLAMIRDARKFVYLSTFYIEYDDYGIELLSALRAAQRRGVLVNLLVDAFGQRLGGVLMSRDERAALADELEALAAEGAVITMYRPDHVVQRALGGGQHVKIQASEAGEVIFGSSNITKSSFDGWNEYSVAVSGPIARTLLDSYRAIGGSVDRVHLDELPGEGDEIESELPLEYWFCNPNVHQGVLGPLGWSGPNQVTNRIVDMIDAAREEILITSFYFKPIDRVMDALLRAAGRGVRIEVFHSHRDALPATDLAWIAAAANYGRLLDAGIAICEHVRGEHSKIVLVDGSWAAFGSYNFEDAAHDRLAEAMLASRDRRAVEPALAIFDELRSDANNVRVTTELLRRLPITVKTRIALLGPFKRWM